MVEKNKRILNTLSILYDEKEKKNYIKLKKPQATRSIENHKYNTKIKKKKKSRNVCNIDGEKKNPYLFLLFLYTLLIDKYDRLRY